MLSWCKSSHIKMSKVRLYIYNQYYVFKRYEYKLLSKHHLFIGGIIYEYIIIICYYIFPKWCGTMDRFETNLKNGFFRNIFREKKTDGIRVIFPECCELIYCVCVYTCALECWKYYYYCYYMHIPEMVLKKPFQSRG